MWDAFSNWVNLWVGQIEATVFQDVILPVVYNLGFGGYAEDAFARNLPADAKFGFLPKPFSLKQLAIAVKETLGR